MIECGGKGDLDFVSNEERSWIKSTSDNISYVALGGATSLDPKEFDLGSPLIAGNDHGFRHALAIC